jgi:S-DNA-T family DNA segregation ATPase FtsK/SpoIIIE
MSYGWRPIASQMVELCDECGYDGRVVVDQASAVAAAIATLDALTQHADAGRRPDADTYSAEEYAAHSVDVTMGLLGYIAQVTRKPLARPGTDLAGCAEVAADVLAGLTDTDRLGVLCGAYPFDVTVDWIVQHLLHDLEHHVLDVRRGYARLAMADHPGGGTVER